MNDILLLITMLGKLRYFGTYLYELYIYYIICKNAVRLYIYTFSNIIHSQRMENVRRTILKGQGQIEVVSQYKC